MKIGDVLNPIPAIPAVATTNPADTAPPSADRPRVDRVTTQDTSDLKSAVDGGISMAAAERGSRLQALAQKVRAGSYRPSVSALADQILAEAELDTHLAKSLH